MQRNGKMLQQKTTTKAQKNKATTKEPVIENDDLTDKQRLLYLLH